MSDPRPIGIFDSGIGGLTVTGAIMHALPAESTLYFGDTARVPYGPKSPEVVRRYSLEILHWLLGQGVKLVTIACNTSTAHALDALRAASPVPVIGVIDPGARAATRASRTGRIGVIGTAGTIASGAYARAIQALRPDAVIQSRACPLFVPFIEEGWLDHPALELVARQYLGPMVIEGIDTLVLGCTHYPLIKPVLAKILGPNVALIDSAEETARAVAAALAEQGITHGANGTPAHRFAVSDDPQRFMSVGGSFLGERVKGVEVVGLGS